MRFAPGDVILTIWRMFFLQSTILGDKLQQKMDSVTFTQERMKRQLDDINDKCGVSW